MKLSLRTKVLVLALLNAVLLAGVLVWFAATQLKQDVGSLLVGESRERLTDVALQIGKDLGSTATKDRSALLERYSAAHGVTFRLYHLNGIQLAGPAAELPVELKEHMRSMRAKTPLLERPEMLARVMRNSREVPGEDGFKLKGQEMERLLAVVTDPPFFTKADGIYWVSFRMPARSSDEPLFQPAQLMLSSNQFFGTPFFFDLRPWLGLIALILLVGIACWWPFVRSATRAIATLAQATGQITRGRVAERIDLRRSDELGQLGRSFNRMADQLEGFIHGQKGFLRDAAHELRSPLSRMQAALGNIAESPVAPETAPFIEDLREEVELMSSLTGELLTLARQENAQRRPGLAPLSLSAMAARVVETENPGSSADVRVQVQPDLAVAAHAESLFRGLSNVVRNAIRYAGEAGPIVLAAERRDDAIIVTVSDHGPGIPDEALELVFTPFYRPDVARTRDTGGNGLGMAIARSCLEACQGTIYCRNRNPGLDVILTLRNA